jgi:WD40 repeat protein
MSNKAFIKPSLEASIEFWGTSDWNPPKGTDNSRLRYVEVHPSKSLILAADKEGRVLLWDYALKTTVVSCTHTDLLLKPTGRRGETNHLSKLPVQKRLSHRSSQRMMASTHSRNDCSSTLRPSSHTIVDKMSVAPALASRIKQQTGQLLQVCFGDTAYRLACIDPAIRGMTFIPSSCPNHMIAVVCENLLIFYDYITGEVTGLTPSDLGDAAPVSVEFASLSYCLIGCSDGVVRVWDWSASPPGGQNARPLSAVSSAGVSPPKGAVVYALNSYSKASINVIKAIPIKQ